MGNDNKGPEYKKIDKENTKLNIFMYDPQKDINKFTLLDRLNEEEKRIKGFKIYKHKYFSINRRKNFNWGKSKSYYLY